MLTPALAVRSLLDAFVVEDRRAAQAALVDLVAALVRGPLPRVRQGAVTVTDDRLTAAFVYTILSDSAVNTVDSDHT